MLARERCYSGKPYGECDSHSSPWILGHVQRTGMGGSSSLPLSGLQRRYEVVPSIFLLSHHPVRDSGFPFLQNMGVARSLKQNVFVWASASRK